MRTGVLSKFLGCWDPDFFGGEQIQALEKEWASYFGVKHAITVNSNTSGLICSVGALKLGPGDEIIVSPYSMSASASVPLFYGVIPVFADIDEEFFCIDPVDVRKKITKKTKAIISVDIFGSPYLHEELRKISKEFNIPIIEDCAQAPGAKYGDLFCGNLGDLGVFSLNYHKHIHTGEGGIIVTNDDDLALRCRLIRNHAEVVVDSMQYKGDLTNLVGFNMRMTEIEATIARVQLKKLQGLVDVRIENVRYLESKLSKIDFLTMPKLIPNSKHVYYVHAIKFDSKKAGISRELFVKAVKAELPESKEREGEGPLMGVGYVKPLYLQSLYQKKIAIGNQGFPFNLSNNTCYEDGLCPVTERMHREELITHELMRPGMTRQDLDDVIAAFYKVAENLSELKK
jgi:perosamine synthetase